MKPPKSRLILPCLLLLAALWAAGAAWAQMKPIAPAPVTLASSLIAVPAPTQGIVFAVGADKVILPPDVTMPPGVADRTILAAAFGEQTQTFGLVITFAPSTRIVLNDNPAAPDLSADVSPLTAFKMLAAGLDDAGWAALTSERGLGLTDLTDGTQKLLFHALFRHGRLWVASQDPELAALPDDQRTDTREVSDQMEGVRVRLGQTAHLYVHDRKGQTIYLSQKPPDALLRLHTWNPKQDPPAAQHNIPIRAAIANTLRAGYLKLEDAAFQTTIPLSGLRTVNDLIARIAERTHRELYADPHYAYRTLTLLGPTLSAPASDLLRALALAVAGTYRQVGPAFVLTDDLVGVGTRRQRVADWEEAASAGQNTLGGEAGEALLKRRISVARSLPSFGESVALTSEQLASMKPDTLFPDLPGEQPSYPFAKLTGAQQTWVRSIAAAYEEKRVNGTLPSYLAEDNVQEADPTGPVTLSSEIKVQMLVPTVSAPVDTNLQFPMFMLFMPGEAAFQEYAHQHDAPLAAKLPPAPPLLPLLRSKPRRAVLGRPRTLSDVDALVAAMRKIGLTELWLDVFSEGKVHLPGSELSDKTLPADAPDILAEALAKTAGTGIAVYADLSLLPWGSAPPEAVCDLSIEGENSRKAALQAHDRTRQQDFDEAGNLLVFVPPPVTVSPVVERVGRSLSALVRSLSARPGLAGFVWEDAEADSALGYTPEMRLRFLRFAHADPVDITPGSSVRADVSLPMFDDPEADKTLPGLWDKARTQVNAALLGRMRAAMTLVPALPILMEQNGGNTEWLASWDDPRQLPPPLRPLFGDVSFPKPPQIAVESHKQGRAVLLRETIKNSADTDALARALQTDLKIAPWDGFVLDFTDVAATRGDYPLAALLRAVSSPLAH